MRTILFLILAVVSVSADSIKVEIGDDAVVVRSPMKEGNFLMRLPPGFQEATAEDPWLAILKKGDARVSIRIDMLGSDQESIGVTTLAKARAGKMSLKGEGGGRRIGEETTGGVVRVALFIRDGKRFYEIDARIPKKNEDLLKALRESLENFTLLDPKGAPELESTDPDAAKAKKLTHRFYKIEVLKPAGFSERPPNPDEDKGIWKHIRRNDVEGSACEIWIRSHLSLKFKSSAEALCIARLKRFNNRYKDVRAPKKIKTWRTKGGKKGYQVQMAGRSPKTGIIVRADYRYVEHGNGRTYEFEMILWGDAPRIWKKGLKAFWRSLKISGG